MRKENLICENHIATILLRLILEKKLWHEKTDKNTESRVLETSWAHPVFLNVSLVLEIAYSTKVTYPEVIAELQLRTKQLGEKFFGHRRNHDE